MLLNLILCPIQVLEVMFVRELSSRLPVSTLIAVSAVNLSFPLNAFHRNKQPPFIRSGVATMKTSLTPRKCGVKYLSTLLLARVRARDMASCCEPKEQSHYVISMEERDFQTPVGRHCSILFDRCGRYSLSLLLFSWRNRRLK